MNTRFEKLLTDSTLPEKDKHVIQQVFSLLPNEKKMRLLHNFETLCYNIARINSDIELEQKILFENFISDMDELLRNSRTKNIS
jgi:hypothetical protein